MQPRGSVPADQAGSLLNPVICKRRERVLRSTTWLPRATRHRTGRGMWGHGHLVESLSAQFMCPQPEQTATETTPRLSCCDLILLFLLQTFGRPLDDKNVNCTTPSNRSCHIKFSLLWL